MFTLFYVSLLCKYIHSFLLLCTIISLIVKFFACCGKNACFVQVGVVKKKERNISLSNMHFTRVIVHFQLLFSELTCVSAVSCRNLN